MNSRRGAPRAVQRLERCLPLGSRHWPQKQRNGRLRVLDGMSVGHRLHASGEVSASPSEGVVASRGIAKGCRAFSSRLEAPIFFQGLVAQAGEQGFCKPQVGSSSLPGSTMTGRPSGRAKPLGSNQATLLRLGGPESRTGPADSCRAASRPLSPVPALPGSHRRSPHGCGAGNGPWRAFRSPAEPPRPTSTGAP